jgi:hypothetical protein
MKFFANLKKALPILIAVSLLAVPAALATYTPTLGVAAGGTGATSAGGARTSLGLAASGANSDITSLSGLTTALSVGQGGTGATDASGARTNLSAAASGANSDITSLTGLTTALSAAQGGTGQSTFTTGDILYASGSTTLSKRGVGSSGQVLTVVSGVPDWAAVADLYTVTPVSATGTAAAGVSVCDATGGAIVLTLPTGMGAGTEVIAKKIDASVNAVTVTKGAGSTIDGANTYPLTQRYQAVSLLYDGTNWNIE